MKISSKGRYALRIMVDLAQKDELTSIKEISIEQGISLKYLEQIVAMLQKANLVEGFRGPNGGYKLTRKPENIPLSEILEATEGKISIVGCLSGDCDKSNACKTRNVWEKLNQNIYDYLKSVTLIDLID